MAKGGRGVVAVIAGAVLVAVGLALVYLLVLAPRRQATKMQGEVEALAGRWAEVRACFYGAEPRSIDPREALIARELGTPGFETELAVCEEALRQARREEGPSSGDEAVEDAWLELRKARRGLGRALAIRLQVPRPRSIAVLRAELIKAAIASETAYAALREAAGLDPDPIDGEAIPAAELEVVKVGDQPAEQVWVESNRLLAARADSAERTFSFIGGDGATPPITARSGQFFGHGGRWLVEATGAEGEPVVLSVVEADKPADGSEPRRVEIGKMAAGSKIIGALDDGESGRLVVAYDPEASELRLFRSSNKGASYRPAVAASNVSRWPTRELFPVQRRLIVAVDPFQRLEIGGPELLVSQRPIYATTCLADSISWWLSDRGLAAGKPGEPLAPVTNSEEMPWLVNACTDNQALGVASVDPEIELPAHKLRLCGRKRCAISASLPRARGARIAAVIGPLAGPAVAFELEGVVLLWSGAEGGSGLKPAAWMRLPEKGELFGLVEWSGQLRAVIRAGDGYGVASFR